MIKTLIVSFLGVSSVRAAQAFILRSSFAQPSLNLRSNKRYIRGVQWVLFCIFAAEKTIFFYRCEITFICYSETLYLYYLPYKGIFAAGGLF